MIQTKVCLKRFEYRVYPNGLVAHREEAFKDMESAIRFAEDMIKMGAMGYADIMMLYGAEEGLLMGTVSKDHGENMSVTYAAYVVGHRERSAHGFMSIDNAREYGKMLISRGDAKSVILTKESIETMEEMNDD